MINGLYCPEDGFNDAFWAEAAKKNEGIDVDPEFMAQYFAERFKDTNIGN